MCDANRPESFSHLFSECEAAESLWAITSSPIVEMLRPEPGVDLRPARLIGDLNVFRTPDA